MLQVAHSCKAKGAASCDVLPVDLSKFGDVEKFAKDVLGKHKQVDVLVNNAGMGAPGKNSPLSDPGKALYGPEVVCQAAFVVYLCMLWSLWAPKCIFENKARTVSVLSCR